ncbi:probable receptor-like serine/threonine-protein kinase At5g57670 [Selaginella moellendorffii]|uniref:probable receptor-like serine/threonine-protein kinase At5g57670 n=1 Tax=Selaginella moellendorffii TaxID=88036 RepID=UPI000D1CE70F|nr:probable receptor-like serine/threonine-protein kinase At5g57670 [Selaginella moellendorffii]|eukprot:XP_024537808.1 probable receptor-like serine/threonine-protein kinase At5g57670 [Selaginella moellendorffii]
MGSKRLKQFLNSSARILVVVKETGEIHGILKLLLSKFAQRKDHITFLHVFQSSEDLQRYQAGLSFDRAICQALLDIHLRTPKVTVSSVVVQSSDICNGIVQEARKIKATLVVLGNSQRQFISRTMSKIGKTCVRNLPSYCSVMVVRKGKVMQVKSGCANCKDHTLKSLLQKENKLEKEESQNSRRSSRASSSSCSMETVLSFSADISSDLSWSSESGSPTTVLKDRTLSRNPKSENVSVKEFSYEELLQATGNFAMENLVGSGGCSHVYKATLQHGTIVAVKHLLNSNSGQREFSREIKFISYIRHQNLVSLIGFCSEGTHRLLVYKFLQNGSLQDHLYGKRKAHFLEKTGATHELVDPNLTILNAHEMRRMMYTAFLCVRSAPDERPNMERHRAGTKLECVRSFVGFCERLLPILEQLDTGQDGELPVALATALVSRAESVLEAYEEATRRSRSSCVSCTRVTDTEKSDLDKGVTTLEHWKNTSLDSQQVAPIETTCLPTFCKNDTQTIWILHGSGISHCKIGASSLRSCSINICPLFNR